MTYWDMDEYQVEDVMTEFLKKSLAQSEFDSTLGTSMSIYPNYIVILSYFYPEFYLEKLYFLTFPPCFPIIFYSLNYCSHLFDERNLKEQVKKHSVTKHC